MKTDWVPEEGMERVGESPGVGGKVHLSVHGHPYIYTRHTRVCTCKYGDMTFEGPWVYTIYIPSWTLPSHLGPTSEVCEPHSVGKEWRGATQTVYSRFLKRIQLID